METIALEILEKSELPILKCNLFGHHIPNPIIPIGIKTEIDIKKGIIEFKEPFLK